MTFPNLDAVQSHLVEGLGYESDAVVKWLAQFTDPREISSLLANPIVMIRDFPITNAEHLARQKRLNVHEDTWDDTED